MAPLEPSWIIKEWELEENDEDGGGGGGGWMDGGLIRKKGGWKVGVGGGRIRRSLLKTIMKK